MPRLMALHRDDEISLGIDWLKISSDTTMLEF
jgi:hypothetical protein